MHACPCHVLCPASIFDIQCWWVTTSMNQMLWEAHNVDRGHASYNIVSPDTSFCLDHMYHTLWVICGAYEHGQGGVVLGSDTRATSGDVIASKNCLKIEEIAPNVFSSGAGTAADCSHVRGNKVLMTPWYLTPHEIRDLEKETLSNKDLLRYHATFSSKNGLKIHLVLIGLYGMTYVVGVTATG